ncbi:ParB/RepB/Spo0J family partition protein [Anaerotignum lactatifermentans]|nr:ParB/RepB/Spo0J family partition protein [Anaerotignum lactatifermentans]
MEQKGKSVIEIHISDLHEFPDHPFRFEMDAEMQELVESVKRYGVLEPILVRQREQGGYVIISGHKRTAACKEIGQNVIPAVVTDCNDDEATILMVDSNIYRRNILPSQKAKAYQMKYEALKHQGIQGGLHTLEQMGEAFGESGKTVQRYVWLARLNDDLLEMLDRKKIGIVPGIALSFLKKEEQEWVTDILLEEKIKLQTKEAEQCKEQSQKGLLTQNGVKEILCCKKVKIDKPFMLNANRIKGYFPDSYSEEVMEEIICQLLEQWKQQRAGGGEGGERESV